MSLVHLAVVRTLWSILQRGSRRSWPGDMDIGLKYPTGNVGEQQHSNFESAQALQDLGQEEITVTLKAML